MRTTLTMISSLSTDMLLDANDLAIGYDRTLQEHLNLRIYSGDIVRIAGPNGSGKTTLLRTLLGYVPRQSGRITYGISPQVGVAVGFVPQKAHDGLLPWFDCYENILLGALQTKRINTGTAFHALLEAFTQAHVARDTMELLEAWAGIDVATRSGGQRQRISLLRTFVTAPRIAFLDEPYLELDEAASRALSTFLSAYVAETRAAIVFVSHHEVLLNATKELTLA
jgi:manganese/zinc/iron transport system ATP- binding protein